MNDRVQPRQAGPRRGLCGRCQHARVIVSDRGSAFVFCERSKTDPRFARYPALPVLDCAGYTGPAGELPTP
jgi:hypothetical protein